MAINSFTISMIVTTRMIITIITFIGTTLTTIIGITTSTGTRLRCITTNAPYRYIRLTATCYDYDY